MPRANPVAKELTFKWIFRDEIASIRFADLAMTVSSMFSTEQCPACSTDSQKKSGRPRLEETVSR
jgi:transposase-like protein